MAFEYEKTAIDRNSALWDKLKELNQQYSTYNFHLIKQDLIVYKKKTSLSKVYGDRYGGKGIPFDFETFVVGQIFENLDFYTQLLSKEKGLLFLFKKYKEYEEKAKFIFDQNKLYKSIDNCPADTRGMISRFFGESAEARFRELSYYEEKRFSEKKIKGEFPIIKVIIYAERHYRDYRTGKQVKDMPADVKFFNMLDMERLFNLALQKKGKMTFMQQQRALISDNIRYEVLKRDGFKCCICGATAKDGSKLEVDHIIPVSKGGQSTFDNLQTLCERCNRGKRDKL